MNKNYWRNRTVIDVVTTKPMVRVVILPSPIPRITDLKQSALVWSESNEAKITKRNSLSSNGGNVLF